MKYGTHVVYKLTNTITGQIYIGETHDINERLTNHFSGAKGGHNSPLCDNIRQYGKESFIYEILEECEFDQREEAEEKWCNKLTEQHPELMLNRTPSGNMRGAKLSEETKKKISEASKGRIFTIETREKLRRSQPQAKAIKETTSGLVFVTKAAAEKYFKTPPGSIGYCCEFNAGNPNVSSLAKDRLNAKGLNFVYATDQEIKSIK